MTSKLHALCGAALLALAPLAQADFVSWSFQGQLIGVGSTSSHQLGDGFQAVVNFDTAAKELTPVNPNRHSLDISALTIRYQIGTDSWQQLDASAGGLIYVRDNQLNPPDPTGPLVDGLTFQLGAVSLILRWSDLSAIDYSQGLLPSTPPALTQVVAQQFQENSQGLTGRIDTVSAVPEPEAYLMLLAGLGLIGALTKRRAQQPG